jgi:hypothetical protein
LLVRSLRSRCRHRNDSIVPLAPTSATLIATMDEFEDTRGLSSEQLYELLETGDAQERVFAIWALGLRSAGAVTMADQLRVEPDAGVRRALAVVLAGQGEIDLLVAMCRHDPSVHVRASAVQVVMRFAVAGRIPWSIVIGRLADEAPVRASVISQVDASSSQELRAAALAALHDEEDLVRWEAFETCAKLARAGALAAGVLRDALDNMTEGDCVNALSTWFSIERAGAIGELLAPAHRAVRERALRLRPFLARTDLAPLLGDDAELFARLEHVLHLDPHEAPTIVLLRLAVMAPWRDQLVNLVIGRLSKETTLVAEQRGLLLELAATFETAQASDDDGDLATYDDDDAVDVEWRQSLHAELRALVARFA